ncbi:MAG TPA: hypothetical protein VNX18_00565 [Bryobacteraceae bacterium]|jgi:uncharacterized protein (TIGR03437 family)|nr:hypothetical protein [Bryobacteraceae bacterium]
MIYPTTRFILIVAAVGVFALGQSGTTGAIAGAGYLFPGPISIAPGQVITIFATGVPRPPTQPVFAGAGDLPTSLAGIGVTIVQATEISAPILQVRSGVCLYCGTMTAITIQIPYELQPIMNGLNPGRGLFVTENGVAGDGIAFNPVFDQVHLLTDCDTVIGGSGPFGGRCPWEVTHANGLLVSNTNPASGGEVLIAYAVGLGATNPAVPTGRPVTQPTPTAETFRMGFNFQANALPSAPPSLAPPPLYAGLTPSYPGLYQINFVVPNIPAGLPPCGSYQGTTIVNTNLTVSVGGQNSFDGVEICVSVPQ